MNRPFPHFETLHDTLDDSIGQMLNIALNWGMTEPYEINSFVIHPKKLAVLIAADGATLTCYRKGSFDDVLIKNWKRH